MRVVSRLVHVTMLVCLFLLPAACAPSVKEDKKKDRKETQPEPEVKIEELKEGTGEAAKVGDWIVIHYVGTFEDGSKFDSTVERQKPARFRLQEGNLIKGWIKGVPGMKPGGKRRLTIPPELAYGKAGKQDFESGTMIPPNSTLIFEIDLLRIE